MELSNRADNEGDVCDDLRREELVEYEHVSHVAIHSAYQRHAKQEWDGDTESKAGVCLI